jgi:filamentous hemagglutinin family protein
MRARAARLLLAAIGFLAAAEAPAQLAPGTVPVLQPGGLVQGAAVGTPGAIPGGNRLDIRQFQPRATIDWATFNIASGSLVRFNQRRGDAALNRIWDAHPSVIQGRLEADAAVYLLNQNGILFDRGSQVNVHTLVASALALNVLTNGKSFFDGGPVALGNQPAFSGFANGPDGKPAAIELLGEVRTQTGGSVMVFASRIRQAGTIAAPDGQVILAAGEKVWLASPPEHDTSMRGLLVEFQADATTSLASAIERSGIVNAGEIGAPRGNVSLGALAINQQGRISASSAAVLNGSVWLVAREGAQGIAGPLIPDDQKRSGSVALAAGSFTGTPLDAADTSTLAEDQSYVPYRGRARIEGGSIGIAGTVASPGGSITVKASDTTQPASTTSTRIYLEPGALLSAAGAWVDLPLEKNLLEFQVTSNELKDSPQQKGGILLAQKVAVDLRKGTPLFDISAYAANVQRGVAEKAAAGGSIEIESQGELIARPGSVLDVSGGGYRYSGGSLLTTRLFADGTLYDIGDAPAHLTYSRVVGVHEKTYERWGVTERFALQPFSAAAREAADIQGLPGGSLSVVASGGAILEGEVRGGASAGRLQRSRGELPAGASFTGGAALIGANTNARQSTIELGRYGALLSSGFSPASPLPGSLAGILHLPAGLPSFGSISLYANDAITLPAETTLELVPGGSLMLGSRRVNVQGTVNVPSGTIALRGTTTDSGANGRVELAAGSQLLARGAWINESPAGLAAAARAGVEAAGPKVLGGGNINLSGFEVALAPGALLDVSGGGRLDALGKLTPADAGGITLASAAGGSLSLGAELRGYALGKGGTLSVSAERMRLGGIPGAGEFAFDPARLAQGGFAQYNLTGLAKLVVSQSVSAHPRVDSYVLPAAGAEQQPAGSALGSFALRQQLPPDRRAPANLTLKTTGSGAQMVLEPGSRLQFDPKAKVRIDARDNLAVHGTIDAPAGTIELKLGADPEHAVAFANELLVGAAARLRARGTFVEKSTRPDRVTGEVLPGGAIALSADRGSVRVAAGAELDVGGASKDLHLPMARGLGVAFEPRKVTSDAGSIAIAANRGLRIEGALLGAAEGTSAGGSLSVDLRLANPSNPAAPLQGTLVAAQSSDGFLATGAAIEGFVALGALPAGGIDALELRAGEAIALRGDLEVALRRRLTLDAPRLSGDAGKKVSLGAPLLRFGGSVNNLVAPDDIAPASGTARLELRALPAPGSSGGLLEVFGFTQLDGFERAQLASAGDLRFAGVPVDRDAADSLSLPTAVEGRLAAHGDIHLSAAQAYPTTFSDFTLRSSAPAGRIGLSASGTAAAPALSAGGHLRLRAATIAQGGVLKAPLGRLTLEANTAIDLLAGSVTSVSADGLAIPYGGTQAGQVWQYAGITVKDPPAKSVSLAAPEVSLRPGAVIDISGGGEIHGAEFLSGSGGTLDWLNPKNGIYAILPALAGGFAPADAHLAAAAPLSDADAARLKALGYARAGDAYDSVHLSGMPGLAEGVYPLLPGYYALADPANAWLVRPLTASATRDLLPGQPAFLADGARVISGAFATTASARRESRSSGFAVSRPVFAKPGALREAEYILVTSGLLAEQAAAADRPAPRLPAGAGQLAIEAPGKLLLEGALRAQAAPGGARGEVSVSAPNIAIVASRDQPGIPAGYLALESAALSALDARLVIGGRRDAAGTRLDVVAGNIEVTNTGSVLRGPEVLLAAREAIALRSGSRIEGAGPFSGTVADLTVAGPGALLRATSGPQIALRRTGDLFTGTGDLTIEALASVSAAGALILDATNSTGVAGAYVVGPGGALDVGARRISAGEAATPGSFRLETASVAGLGDLRLRSYETLDLHGRVSLGGSALRSLTLSAAGLSGYRVGGVNEAFIEADVVRLSRTGGASLAGSPDGSGSLTVRAREIRIGSGDLALAGFGHVALTASESLIGSGVSTLEAASSLAITAGRITGESGSVVGLSATGNVTLARSGTVPAGALAPGARLSVTGAAIAHGGRIEVPSGEIALTATAGDIVLADGSLASVTGYSRRFADATVFGPAGKVALVASGAVSLAPLAEIDVSNPAGAGAGELRIAASTLAGSGVLRGTHAAGHSGAVLRADLGAAPDLLALDSALRGFAGRREVRARTGDLTLAAGGTFNAREVRLVADAGSISIGGRIDASSPSGGGRIELAAARSLTLSGGSELVASGTSAGTAQADPYSHGGLVRLESRHASGGRLDFLAGARIDVSAGAKGDAGRVEFVTSRAPLADATLAGAIVGMPGAGGDAGAAVVYANKVTTGVTSASMIATGDADYASFMGTSGSPSAGYLAAREGIRDSLVRIGMPRESVNVRAAVELQSTDPLALSSPWDLTRASVLVDGQPGLLTIRTSDSLDIRALLGLPNPVGTQQFPNTPIQSNTTNAPRLFGPEAIPAAPGWFIQLVGGADHASADRLAVLPLAGATSGDVTLTVKPAAASPATARTARSGQSVRVRTTTGDIEIAARRDFGFRMDYGNFSATESDAAFNAERARALRAAVYTTGAPAFADSQNRFLERGGDVRIFAQRDAFGFDVGAITVSGGTGGGAFTNRALPALSVQDQPFANDWLRRTTTGSSLPQTSFDDSGAGWWAYRPLFNQNIGSFGGGAVVIAAGRDVNRLSAANASSGRVIAGAGGAPGLEVAGGGRLEVAAGRDIAGGAYLAANGAASVSAGLGVGRDLPTQLHLIGESADLARQGQRFDVRAGGDIAIQSISNPTIFGLTLPASALFALGISSSLDGFRALLNSRRAFFTYSPQDSVSLLSLSGDIRLDSRAAPARSAQTGKWSDIVPPIFAANALAGDVLGARAAAPSALPIRLFPSEHQSLAIRAAGDISGFSVETGDVLRSLLPAWNHSTPVAGENAPAGFGLTPGDPAGRQMQSIVRTGTQRAVAAADAVRHHINAGGSIDGVQIFLADSARIDAGLDLLNVQLELQNLAGGALTTVRAGRDIRYGGRGDRYRSGDLLENSGGYVRIGGPGRLLVQAGRNINLGETLGIQAAGKVQNPALPGAASAAVTVIAGYAGALELAAVDALFADLASAGRANDAVAGDAAVARVFGDSPAAAGNLTMFRSAILTEGGSPIDILVPAGAPGGRLGGNVNAGLPGEGAASNLGIITRLGGGIRVYTRNDFVVNSSRVVTQLGGDILAYTSWGSIDAGRGARSARTFGEARIVEEDLNGDGTIDPITERFFRPPLHASGSGIRTISFDPDGAGPQVAPKPGSVYLFAPRGTIDAGEAGIVSAGDVVVVALQVLNAANIAAQGSSTGVPVAQSGGLAASLVGATSGAAAAAQSGTDAARPGPQSGFRPSFITVRVIGFGE